MTMVSADACLKVVDANFQMEVTEGKIGLSSKG
jgi:hypothetical protein